MRIIVIALLLLYSQKLLGAEATNIKLPKPTTTPAATPPQAKQNSDMKAQQKELSQEAAMAQRMSPEVMIIDPAIRAQDFKEAFNYLMQYKGGAPLFFELQDREKLYNVLDVSLMKGGTMMIFKINSAQGLKYRVVMIEDIVSIGSD